jgi:hypothetical protein
MFRPIWACTASTSSINEGGETIQPMKIAAANITTVK